MAERYLNILKLQSAPQAFMLVSAAKGLSFQRRTSAGGLSVSTAGGVYAAPRWVRLDRIASTLSAYQSADGANWALVGTDTIPMASTAPHSSSRRDTERRLKMFMAMTFPVRGAPRPQPCDRVHLSVSR